MKVWKFTRIQPKALIKNGIFIVAIVSIYITFFDTSTVLKSEENYEYTLTVEDYISESSKNIVGISKTYEVSDEGWGSGIVVSNNGYILTNEHVSGVQNNICYVIINLNEKYKANVVWSNSDIDLSILKIDHEFESCCKLGDSDQIKIGQKVYSIGNPISYNLKNTVSSGIISSLNRNIELEENGSKTYMSNLIQTDININSGNSGGALINETGEVIGITTLKITSANGISFSVPINVIKPIIDKLEKGEQISNITLGITGYDKYSIETYNPKINLENGIYVAIVKTNSKSEKAGLQTGDIIKEINGKEITTINQLRAYLFEENSYSTIHLLIERNGKNYYFSLTD